MILSLPIVLFASTSLLSSYTSPNRLPLENILRDLQGHFFVNGKTSREECKKSSGRVSAKVLAHDTSSDGTDGYSAWVGIVLRLFIA